MIRELVELAEKLRERSAPSLTHDALKVEQVGIDCIITSSGEFVSFQCFDKVNTIAEALTSKKGKARLLLDKCEEVLEVNHAPNKTAAKEGTESLQKKRVIKHALFRAKLDQFKDVAALELVRLFYANSDCGLVRAREAFVEQVPEKKQTENIAFRLKGAGERIHEATSVYDALKGSYEAKSSISAGKKRCSVCGSNQYLVEDIPHGMIKQVPAGKTSGCALVSYNDPAFESYGLVGNNNSAVCTHCAKSYVESLNWLMNNRVEILKKESGKPQFLYSNMKKISRDTALVFWLKNSVETELLDLLETPTEDSIKKLIDSPFAGVPHTNLDNEAFYGIILSGVAARISIRNWIQVSLSEVRKGLARWFDDVAVFRGGKGSDPSCIIHPAIYALVNACQREKGEDTQVAGRIGAALWHSAIMGSRIPLWILSSVLRRLKAEQGKVTPERAALIKLFLIRNKTIKGAHDYMKKLEEDNKETPYLCGRLFAVLERLQYHAQGEVNAGIGERFFTAASSTPRLAFGRLIKLAKQHLSKLKGKKPGLSVNIDKEIQAILSTVQDFPVTFRLEEQGQFALGYYHQKNSRGE